MTQRKKNKNKTSSFYRKRKSKTGYKRKKYKKPMTLFLFILIFIIFIITVSLIYTIFIFPETLRDKIKNDLISIYKPLFYDDSDSILILRLEEKPDDQIQKRVYDVIKNKYGLEVKFERINDGSNNGINEIKFFNNLNEFQDIRSIYIYWDEQIVQKVIEEKKDIEQNNYKEEKKIDHEKFEKKRQLTKKRKIKKPQVEKFKYSKFKETPHIEKKAKLAIIIDDVGYMSNSTYDFLTLGFPVTFALIPDMPKSDEYYHLFNKYKYEIILHIPMEPLKGKKYVEKNALFTDMSDNDIRNRIDYFINKYPLIVGANNHMGSKAVLDARLMNILLGELKKMNLFWLDSRTVESSISKEIASINKLEYYQRDVFLDNYKDRKSIYKFMNILIKKAKNKGYAIGIGHVQSKELVPVLKEFYNNKDKLGIEFVPLSSIR